VGIPFTILIKLLNFKYVTGGGGPRKKVHHHLSTNGAGPHALARNKYGNRTAGKALLGGERRGPWTLLSRPAQRAVWRLRTLRPGNRQEGRRRGFTQAGRMGFHTYHSRQPGGPARGLGLSARDARGRWKNALAAIHRNGRSSGVPAAGPKYKAGHSRA